MAPMTASRCTVTFRVRAETAYGDSLVLIGSGDELGNWDPTNHGIPLTTTAEEYPIWSSAPIAFKAPLEVEYKYVRLTVGGEAQWETLGDNRMVPPEPGAEQIVMDDGVFGYIMGKPFGFVAGTNMKCPRAFPQDAAPGALRLVVAGDSVAAGAGAWGFNGWAAQLGKVLHEKWGYGYVNVAQTGHDASQVLASFDESIAPLKPSVVVLALGLELERLVTCPDWDRKNIAAHLLKTLGEIVEKVWEIGALPVIGGPYAHADFQEEQVPFVCRVQDDMRATGVPMLDWLHQLCVDGADLTWQPELSHSRSHPDAEGHRRMLQVIDVAVFDPAKVKATMEAKVADTDKEQVVFKDGNGFEVRYKYSDLSLRVSNTTQSKYTMSCGWEALQESLEKARREAPWSIKQGVYITERVDIHYGQDSSMVGVSLGPSGRLCSEANFPPGSNVTLRMAREVIKNVEPLFHAGPLMVLFDKDAQVIRIINESDGEYNVHPMWQEFRKATRKLPQGIYEDDSGAPFRTAVVSVHGVQSRVKVPPYSAMALKWKGKLESLKRIAVLPLGDRCSIRMLLHKIEYDGPCYPFDLTRTTSLSDVADMVCSGFKEMWYEELLWYDHDAGRVFHKKWGGLSFAHEVEWEGPSPDDPVNNLKPVVARMAKRYGGRAARFDYACEHADEVCFIRTGCSSRGEVEDCLQRLAGRYPGVTSRMLLISDQDSSEFDGIGNFSHERQHFDPDRMYEEMSYWIQSAHEFRGILDRHGINARSLYWCPNNLKEAEAEIREAAKEAAKAAGRPTPELTPAPSAVDVPAMRMPDQEPSMRTRCDNFSHNNLYKAAQAAEKGVQQASKAAPDSLAPPAIGA
mmetsp:Transcript_51519/g.136136  ORF Transcript_51519/g.136136 Transcript_51519/m.136136 type:complete len:854 (-) Transcript_51519:195-2756(-)